MKVETVAYINFIIIFMKPCLIFNQSIKFISLKRSIHFKGGIIAVLLFLNFYVYIHTIVPPEKLTYGYTLSLISYYICVNINFPSF